MKRIVMAGVLALAALPLAAQAEPGNPKVGIFAQGAGLSNAFELEESKIILEDSKNPTLRRFAADMIRDHGMAQQKLRRAGAMAGVTTDFVLASAQQKSVNDLGLMEGQALDDAYVADQVAAHANAAATLSGYITNGTDPALRAYARQTLPVVLMHQRMLEEITGQPAPL